MPTTTFDGWSSSPPPSCHRSSEQSIVLNLLSVEQKRSPHILPESRAFKNLSPHISPTTRAEICCKVPIKSPYFPISARGPPLGEADDKCITMRFKQSVELSECSVSLAVGVYSINSNCGNSLHFEKQTPIFRKDKLRRSQKPTSILKPKTTKSDLEKKTRMSLKSFYSFRRFLSFFIFYFFLYHK